jgi:hypothetical protein
VSAEDDQMLTICASPWADLGATSQGLDHSDEIGIEFALDHPRGLGHLPQNRLGSRVVSHEPLIVEVVITLTDETRPT